MTDITTTAEVAQLLIYLTGKRTSLATALEYMHKCSNNVQRTREYSLIPTEEIWKALCRDYYLVMEKRKINSIEELYAAAYSYFHSYGGMSLYLG